MNSKRFHFIMIGVTVILGLAILLSAYFGNGLLHKQAQRLVSLKLDSQIAQEQQNSLLLAKQDILKYSDLYDEAKEIVPQDKDQAQAVREIVKIAAKHGVKLGSITFPASSLGQSTPKPAAPAEGTAAPAAPKTPPVTQVQPVAGISGVYVMPITVQSNTSSPVTYTSVINFLNALEHNRRTAQVSSVTISPDSKNPSRLSFNLIVNVYIKP